VPVWAIELAFDVDVSILDHLARYDPYDGGLGADSGSSATCHWLMLTRARRVWTQEPGPDARG
jgi:hypothetical protein